MKSVKSFDLVVIGAGGAGLRAAAAADGLGASVALVDKDWTGGTCLNAGCVPTKTMLRSAQIVHLAKRPGFRSISGNQYIGLTFNESMAEAREMVATIRRDEYELPLRRLSRVERVEGRARFIDSRRVDVDGRLIEGDAFVLATGSTAIIPGIPGLESVGALTSTDIFKLSDPPESLIVLGAGALGLEFAQMFAHFSSSVRVVQRSDQVLRDYEPEVAAAVKDYLEDDGIEIDLGVAVSSARCESGLKVIEGRMTGFGVTYKAEEIMIAAGRRPNTAGLGLEEIGVALDAAGAVIVDDEMATNVPHILAAGDVTGKPMLENVAAAEGEIAARNALGPERLQLDYDALPGCVFTHPEAAQVGMREVDAVARGHAVEAQLFSLAELPKAGIMRDRRGLIKLIAGKNTGRVLGCSVVAENGGELINLAAMAVKLGLRVDDLASMVYVYPTLSEAIGRVARLHQTLSKPKVEIDEERKAA